MVNDTQPSGMNALGSQAQSAQLTTIEKMLVSFLEQELVQHPEIAENLINHFVEQSNLNPTQKAELEQFVAAFLPQAVGLLK